MPDTTNYGWTYPVDQASDDTWGATLNTLFQDIDTTVFNQLAQKANLNAAAATGAWTFAATVKKAGKGHFLYYDDAAYAAGKITVSTSAPSGTPAKGDIWLKVAASSAGWQLASVYVGLT
jgi:hypothetical protein